MKYLKRWIPEYARLPLIVALALHLVAYSAGKLIASGWHHYNMETALDQRIPFLSWTVLIYVGSYLFWVVNGILSIRYDRKAAFRFFTADAMSKVVVFLLFLTVPTMTVRPELERTGFCNLLLGLIYTVDTPDGLFPSMHCVSSWLSWLGVRKQKEIPGWYRWFSLVFALMVFVSTLTTKQHVIADVIAGCLLPSVCWWIAGRTGISDWCGYS